MNDLELAAYLDRGLSPEDRERVEEHLSSCEDCRAHISESSRLLRRKARPRFIITASAVAAALLFVVAVPAMWR
jgi:predicted anti-sigma-YlaC factor YlaD